jgi:hypothetical protein
MDTCAKACCRNLHCKATKITSYYSIPPPDFISPDVNPWAISSRFPFLMAIIW